jgi:hypothetical protein
VEAPAARTVPGSSGLGGADMVAVVRAIEQRTAIIVGWRSSCQGGSVGKPVTVTVFSDYV